jgi:ferredoxin-thioredoxin reductase catalytic chain
MLFLTLSVRMGEFDGKRKTSRIDEKICRIPGIQVKPDEEVVNFIIKGLLENEARRGYKYCSCRVITGDRRKDAKLICPCLS